MATINIGGRDLDVKECTIDLWREKYRPYQKAVFELTRASKDSDAAVENADFLDREDKWLDLVIELVIAFAGHNEGVTREWLVKNMSYPPPEAELLIAAGLRKKDPTKLGEAQSQ